MNFPTGIEWIDSRVKVHPTTGCWLWTRVPSLRGRAKFRLGGRKGKMVTVSVWLWAHKNGPVPVGKELDHLCRVRHCINPEHLEAVTRRENLRRGAGTSGDGFRRKNICSKGHLFDAKNLHLKPTGTRRCRKCNAEGRMRRYYARQNLRLICEGVTT